MEEETEKKYEEIVQFCRQNHTPFVDYEFPPNDESIGKAVFKVLEERYKKTKLTWLRPNQIVTDHNDGKWSVFNDPKPSDVTQSPLLKNCWFISAMAAIAERPEVLDNIFPSKEYSPEGIYRVRLYFDGQWKTVLVDDYFPCNPPSSRMVTSECKLNQLWAPLIEKALAKQHGSYSVFDKGASPNIGFAMLTGACGVSNDVPSDPDDFDLFWNIVKSSKSSDFLMSCTSKNNDFREKRGVYFEHSYSILDLNDDYGNRLLLLRNPHGKDEWTGKWSKNWDGWPTSMREELSIDKERGDGTFWIEFDDFMSKFRSITVCKIRPDWHEIRYELTIGLDTPTVKLTVTETCEASFVVISRKEFNTDSALLDDIMISVHRISDENIVGEMIGRSDHFICYYISTDDFLLTPGKYIIMLYNFENMNKVPIDKVLLCYSSKSVFHELISQTPLMFNQAIREIVLKDGKMINDEFGIFRRTLSKNFRGAIHMADNFLKTQYLHLSIDFSKTDKNCKASRGSLKTTDIIPPMSYQIIQIILPNHHAKRFNWCRTGSSDVTREKFIEKEITHDRSIISQNLQHYPIIDPLDPIHNPQSIFYDSRPIKESTKKICQKRIKHLLRRCECRT